MDALPPAIVCPSPAVVDGDTILCGTERLQLIGIDAPELEGCPEKQKCVPGNPLYSQRSLQRALKYGPFRYRIVTRNLIGRPVVLATAGRVNLSCWQLSHSQARYRADWDVGGEIAKACR